MSDKKKLTIVLLILGTLSVIEFFSSQYTNTSSYSTNTYNVTVKNQNNYKSDNYVDYDEDVNDVECIEDIDDYDYDEIDW